LVSWGLRGLGDGGGGDEGGAEEEGDVAEVASHAVSFGDLDLRMFPRANVGVGILRLIALLDSRRMKFFSRNP